MTNGTYLGKEAILAAVLGYEDVSVPEWDGTVRISEMSAADRELFTVAIQNREKARDAGERVESVQALLASLCIVDSAGTRVFSAADVGALERKSGRALTRVCNAIMELSALKRENVEELKKNSETSTSADSHTA